MRMFISALAALFVVVCAPIARADQGGQADRPFLSPLFGDNMVLQRGIPDPVWGWAAPGTAVSVRMGSKTARAVADREGKWVARIGPMPAGGPFELTVS